MLFTLMQIVYGPATPFVTHPERAYMMAAGFAFLAIFSFVQRGEFKPLVQIPILLTVLVWVAFGRNEMQAQQNGWNIRVDLLFFWPVVFVITLASAWLGVRGFVVKREEVRLGEAEIEG